MWDRMEKGSVEWQFFLETIWDFQGLKEKDSLTTEVKDVFYDNCQGITAVAVNLFILAQERALSEGKEKITTKILRDTTKEDLAMLQPMIKALRNNNQFEIMKYEDISLNLDDIAFEHSRNIELNGKIEELFKERKKTIELKRRNTVENLVMDLCEIGIFDNIDNLQMRKLVEKIVNDQPVEEAYNSIKVLAVKKAMELNEKTDKAVKNARKEVKRDGLLYLYEKAIKIKQHPYEALKQNGYIKHPIEEFLKVN